MGAIELPNVIETGNKSGQGAEGQMLVEQFRKKLKETSSANQSTDAFLPKDFTFTETSTSPSSSQTSLSLSSTSTLDSFSSFIGIASSPSSITTLAPPFFIPKSTTNIMNGPSSFIPVTKDVVLLNDDATAVESLADNLSLLPPLTFISSAPTASPVALTSTTSQFPNDSPTTTFSSSNSLQFYSPLLIPIALIVINEIIDSFLQSRLLLPRQYRLLCRRL